MCKIIGLLIAPVSTGSSLLNPGPEKTAAGIINPMDGDHPLPQRSTADLPERKEGPPTDLNEKWGIFRGPPWRDLRTDSKGIQLINSMGLALISH